CGQDGGCHVLASASLIWWLLEPSFSHRRRAVESQFGVAGRPRTADGYRFALKADRIGPYDDGNQTPSQPQASPKELEKRRGPADQEHAQKATGSDQALARGERREGREGKERRRLSRRRGRREGHGAQARAGPAVAGDGGLLQEMRREARLHPERAEGLCLRQRQARGLRRISPAAGAERRDAVEARDRDDRDRGVVAEPLLLLHHRPWQRRARARRSGA